MNKILVKFGAAYMESPVMMKDSDIFHHCNIQDLKISDDLKSKIINWDNVYQKTFNEEYPPDSGFKHPEDEVSYNEDGRTIASELQCELGNNYLIEYIKT